MNIRKISLIIFTGVILNSFLIAAACATQQLDGKTKAPELSLKSPTGETAPLATFIGKKPVMLVFWASWCTNCRDEIPHLSKLNADHFKVIAVNEGESAWKTKRFMSMNNIDYQVALDSDGVVAKAFQVPGVPACVILNRFGMVVYRGLGLPENIESYAGQ
jgi:thiol-disulfide isomerase/thioredoxin